MAFSKFHKQLAWFRQRYQGGMNSKQCIGAEGGFKSGFQHLNFLFYNHPGVICWWGV